MNRNHRKKPRVLRHQTGRRRTDPPPTPCRDDLDRPEESLLERIAEGAQLCRDIEEQLREHPAPELETIIKMYRTLVLRLSAEAPAVPELRHLVSTFIKPVLDWARLEEKRKDRELAEQRRREAAQQKTAQAGANGSALKPETLEEIEHELHLF